MVSPEALALDVGDSATLAATAVNVLGVSVIPAVTWISFAPSVATVTAQGVVTAIAPGSTQIAATAGGLTVTVPTVVYAGPSVHIVVDGAGRRFGPLPVITYALADNATGTDIYPVGPGERLNLFGLFDTGSTRVRLYNETPYSFQVAGDPNQGLALGVPHRVTNGNYFASDAVLLGMFADEIVRVRLNGLGAINPTTLVAPFGAGTAQREVPNVSARPQPIGDSLDVTLIGGPITWSIVAWIDYTTSVLRGPYDFYPGLVNRTPAGTGIAGFAPIDHVLGPTIMFYTPGDAAIPQLPLELMLKSVPTRYELLGLELRNGTATWRDTDPLQLPWVHFDTGTTITFFGDAVAAALGLSPGTGSFDCLTGEDNGYVIDAAVIHGWNGSYAVSDYQVCWDQASMTETSIVLTTGSNLFDQVPTVFDGPAFRYWVGPPTSNPVTWWTP